MGGFLVPSIVGGRLSRGAGSNIVVHLLGASCSWDKLRLIGLHRTCIDSDIIWPLAHMTLMQHHDL